MKPSEAYLKAKREVVEVIDNRISDIKQPFIQMGTGIPELESCQVAVLEDVRNYVRNIMLWKNRDGE